VQKDENAQVNFWDLWHIEQGCIGMHFKGSRG
jgi:hypothetical protein